MVRNVSKDKRKLPADLDREVIYQFAGSDDSAEPVTDFRFTSIFKEVDNEGVKKREIQIEDFPEEETVEAVKISW